MRASTYIPADYEAAIPSNLPEDQREGYDAYLQDVSKNFAVEYARTMNSEVGHKTMGVQYPGAYCEEYANKCENDTLPRVDGAADLYKGRPQTVSCPRSNDKNYDLIRNNPEIGGGYVNIKDYVAEVQKHDPYCVIDVVIVNSKGGLHRVTIAPTIDDNGNPVIDPQTNLPKMTVYSFNNDRKTPLESYKTKEGFCTNMNDYARCQLRKDYERDPVSTQQRIDVYNQTEHQVRPRRRSQRASSNGQSKPRSGSANRGNNQSSRSRRRSSQGRGR